MKIQGLPNTFWVVTSPSPHSILGDICFECDFRRLVRVVRGGLDEQTIIGIFTDQTEAVEQANLVLHARQQAMATEDICFHKSPWANWYATQESPDSVTIYSKNSGEQTTFERPEQWGGSWCWNISPDGSGIVMQRRQ